MAGLSVCSCTGCNHCGERCSELVRGGRCADCRRPDRRPSASRRGYDVRWRRIRAQYLKHHPDCQHSGCNQPATEVHHIKAKVDGGSDRWQNLRGYCKPHHSQRTARDQPGGWNA